MSIDDSDLLKKKKNNMVTICSNVRSTLVCCAFFQNLSNARSLVTPLGILKSDQLSKVPYEKYSVSFFFLSLVIQWFYAEYIIHYLTMYREIFHLLKINAQATFNDGQMPVFLPIKPAPTKSLSIQYNRYVFNNHNRFDEIVDKFK